MASLRICEKLLGGKIESDESYEVTSNEDSDIIKHRDN